ncbi:flagellar biosynthetic protein FliO [Rhizobium tubonense]|uniref:Flagellar biosynthesis protein FliO n=1 Tax=Rhizobium tubonense TaxID=484088 RepID=A0A2W4EFS9_9HYPH|nr:flagellar biosynthetic protein FliO [Rhizobium tubonense]PZM13126.1 flagellar biosynthesis protein FliO [Rhizobium tubonense]
MLDEIVGAYGNRFFIAAGGVGIALLILIAVLWLLRSRAPSPFVRGGRNRQPRLQVLDAAAVDARRRLVLVRRDGVEHLIMIGGPTDIVIESGISAAKIALAPNASFETLVANETMSPPPRLEPPRETPRAIEMESAEEVAAAPVAPTPPPEVAPPKPAVAQSPSEPASPPEKPYAPEPAAPEPPHRPAPALEVQPVRAEIPPAERPEPVVVAPVPPAKFADDPAPVIKLSSPHPIAVEPPAPVVPTEKPHVPSVPAFEPRHRPEQTAAFEPVRRPPPPPVEEPQPPEPVSIRSERRPEPAVYQRNEEAEAADILDAARHRVLVPEEREPQMSSPAQSMPVVADGVPVAPQDGNAGQTPAPVVSLDTASTDTVQAAKPRDLGIDFESILEAEMSNNLSAQRIIPNAPVPPGPNAAQPVPGQRRDPEMAPLTGADSTLQREVARIFGEMSVNRDK